MPFIFSGGGADGDDIISDVQSGLRNDRKEILEFNHEAGSWTVIGEMKESREYHAVSLGSFNDYEKWCN